jgi:arsenate reductase
MKKNVLVLCTGNSCRSILAEALLNAEMGERLTAYSSGVKASGRVNPHAIDTLKRHNLPTEGLHSKTLEALPDVKFDLVITVCDHAHETCPLFPGAPKTLHVGMEDPDGQGEAAFEATFREIQTRLIPAVREVLGL